MITLRKIRRRHNTLAYAVLAVLVFAAAIPAVLGSRSPILGLSGAALVAAARDRHTISTPVALVPTAGLTLDRGTVSLATSQNRPLSNGEAILKMLYSGAARLVLEDAVIGFASPETASEAITPGAEPSDVVSPLISALLEARFEQLSLRRSTLELRDRDGRSRVLSDINATILAKRNGTVSAQGSFVYVGQTVAFDTTLYLGDRSNSTRIPLRAAIKGQLFEVNLPEARLSVRNSWQLSSQQATVVLKDVRKVARWLVGEWPDGPGLTGAKIEGTLDAASQTFSFQRAKITLDGNEATGAMLINFTGPRPAVDATLALQSLDISRYLPSAWTSSSRGAEAEPSPALAAASAPQALSFPILRHFDADLRLSASKVSAGQTALGKSAATITLRAGRLAADLAELEIDDSARANAQISVDVAGSQPRFALRASIRNLEMEALARAVCGQAVISGAGGVVTADLAGTGDSAGPLAGTLSGKVSLKLPLGGAIALDVPTLFASAQARSDDEAWTMATRGQTLVDDLEATLRVSQGVWTSESLFARTGNALITATGIVDVPGSEVDVVVTRTNANRTIDFSGANLPLGMAHVRGALAAPRVMPAARSKKASEQTEPGGSKAPEPPQRGPG